MNCCIESIRQAFHRWPAGQKVTHLGVRGEELLEALENALARLDVKLLDVTKAFQERMEEGESRIFLCCDSMGRITGGDVVLHETIGMMVHPQEMEAGYKVGAHLGDLLIVMLKNDQYTAKLLTDDEAKEEHDGVFTHGLMTSNEKMALRELKEGLEKQKTEKLSYPSKGIGGNNMDNCLESGVYPYNWKDTMSTDAPTYNTGKNGQFDLHVFCTTTPDATGYNTTLQIAVCREGLMEGQVYIRNIFHNGETKDIRPWILLNASKTESATGVADYEDLIKDAVDMGDYHILQGKDLSELPGYPIMKAYGHTLSMNHEWTKNGAVDGLPMGDDVMKENGWELVCAWGFYSSKMDIGSAVALYWSEDETMAIKFAEV